MSSAGFGPHLSQIIFSERVGKQFSKTATRLFFSSGLQPLSEEDAT